MKPPPFKWMEFDSSEARPLRIVADGAIASRGVHAGLLLPCLLLDLSERVDIEKVIKLAPALGSGESETQWGQLKNRPEHRCLVLRFTRPVEAFCVIEFEILKQGMLIDTALAGNGMYIAKALNNNDRLAHDIHRKKLSIEIPDSEFKQYWPTLYREHVVKYMRRNGSSRRGAEAKADQFMQKRRELLEFRMKDVHPT